MKLRARKGEGSCFARRNRRAGQRPDLPDGRRRRSAGACSGAGTESQEAPDMRAASSANYSAAKMFTWNCSGISAARKKRAIRRPSKSPQTFRLAAAGHQWRLPRAAAAARSAGCLHLHPPSPHACLPPAPATPQFRAPFEISRGDGAIVCRSSRSHRQYGNSFFALAIHVERFGLRISRNIRFRTASHRCNFCASARAKA